MRSQMDARMAQFVEAITNVTRNQEELKALVKRPCVENERPELMFEDVSVGKPRPNVAVNFSGLKFNGPYSHAGPTVNVVDDDESLNLIMDVNMLSTPLLCLKSYLIKNDVFPGCFPDCYECQSRPEGCVHLKIRIQNLISEDVLQCDRIIKDEKG
ncbi:hypothetical protein KIW84_051442 [Lathyrus oleraceus]|uniref:Uncharacterized protein n=1 Tax=Pisum sativum TaxID=3888 RepID=A0A9D4WP47_PEA|nr:hypothetical protein KIW84_051442 [Pisum sativum]